MLILDEPTAGLDPKQIIETRELIKELGGDHTVILSTHILPEVSQTCHRVVIINKGRVVAVDTPDNLTARLRGIGDDVSCRSMPRARTPTDALSSMPGVTQVRVADRRGRGRGASKSKAKRAATCGGNWRRQSSAAGWGLLELRPMRMSLEEIFLHLTTEDAATSAGRAAGEVPSE